MKGEIVAKRICRLCGQTIAQQPGEVVSERPVFPDMPEYGNQLAAVMSGSLIKLPAERCPKSQNGEHELAGILI